MTRLQDQSALRIRHASGKHLGPKFRPNRLSELIYARYIFKSPLRLLYTLPHHPRSRQPLSKLRRRQQLIRRRIEHDGDRGVEEGFFEGCWVCEDVAVSEHTPYRSRVTSKMKRGRQISWACVWRKGVRSKGGKVVLTSRTVRMKGISASPRIAPKDS